MNFLRRATIILAGYFAAAAVGLIVPTGFLYFGFPDKPSLSRTIFALRGAVSLILSIGAMLLIPALVVITVCEVLRIRSLFAYLTLGIVISFALTIYAVGLRNTSDQTISAIALLIGAAAGFAYWRIAGRDAGRWRESRLPEDRM